MPRVHYVKKARKDNPAVKAGEPYYWWQSYRDRKRYSATYPRPSQLTMSRWGDVYAAREAIEDATTMEELNDAITEAIDAVQTVGGEYHEADDAMGGNMLINYERGVRCEEIVFELETLLGDVETWSDLDDVKSMATDGVDWDMP